jgi:hypothetical protein
LAKYRAIPSETSTPPSGTSPDVTRLAKVIMAGSVFQCWQANQAPVRPNPAMPSSKMRAIPCRSQISRTPRR